MADVATTHPAFERMRYAWGLAEVLRGGTRAMRADAQALSASEQYDEYATAFTGAAWIEQFRNEDAPHYADRLKRGVLWDFWFPAVLNLASKPFGEDVNVKGPDELLELQDDIDAQGHSITRFMEMAAVDGWFYGGARGIVDSPERPAPDMAQATANRDFPFLSLISPRRFYNWKTDARNRFAQVRINTCRDEEDPNDEFNTNRVNERVVYTPTERRVYRPYQAEGVSRWRRLFNGLGGEQVDAVPWWGKTDYVPAYTLYNVRLAPQEFQSGIESVMWMNGEHYGLRAAYKWALTQGLDRTLVYDGVDRNDVKQLNEAAHSPKYILYMPKRTQHEPRASVFYVVPPTDGIEQAEKGIDKLEAAMVARTLKVQMPQTGNRTATEAGLDAADEVSMLAAFSTRQEHWMENLCRDLLRARGVTSEAALDEVVIEVNKNFGLSMQQQKELEELDKARERGDITPRAYLDELQRRGVLNADMQLDEMMAEEQEEQQPPPGERPEGEEPPEA